MAASCLARGLFLARDRVLEGERDPARLVSAARAAVEAERRAALEYAEARDPETLSPLAGPSKRMTILLAARIGAARLIDNITLKEGEAT